MRQCPFSFVAGLFLALPVSVEQMLGDLSSYEDEDENEDEDKLVL